jgi:branched-chain amino acid transport system permease protein
MVLLKDLKPLRLWKMAIAICLWVLGIFIPLAIRDPFALHVFNFIFLGGVLGLAWTILARTEYITFAHNAFMGIGAYTSAYLVMKLRVPFGAGFLAAGALSGMVALFLGAVILRLKGIFFVLSTFCFAQIMLRVFRIAVPITGGADGIKDIPPPVLPFIGSVKSHEEFYILFYVYTTLVVIFTIRLFNSTLGKEFKAIGEDMFVAESMGIDTTRQKIIAFVISSVIVGFSGSLYAHYVSFISDTSFEMIKSIEPVIYNAVGGMGSIAGIFIGAAVMVPLPEFLRSFVAYQIALYGLILILILRFFPMGIWGTGKQIIRSILHVETPTKLKGLRLSSDLAKRFSLDFSNPIKDKRETLLECSELSRYFGGLAALSEVSLVVGKGEILGIVGPNGAGKTTLYNVITGVLFPSKGSVIFQGENISGLKPNKISRLGINRVFQARVLYSEATVKENVARALITKIGLNKIKDFFYSEKEKNRLMGEQVQQILKLFGLEPVAEELCRNLPHGFQRLLALAMALAVRPRLLLLDEPVTGMSVEEMDAVASILEKLHESGLTMVVVEHNVDFVMRLCSRIIVLNYGQKIAEGTPREIQNNPKVIEAYLGEVNERT